MHRLKISFLFLILLVQISYSAGKLDFTKQKYYSFGSGEYSKIFLELKNYDTYNYEGDMKPPFVMKASRGGNLEFIFDMRTVESADLEVGRTYKESFVFTKKNIGKKQRIYLSATYRPEVRFFLEDSLKTDFVHVVFTPENTSEQVIVSSIKSFSTPFQYDENDHVSVTSDTGMKFKRGDNSININLLKEENFKKELVIYRNTRDGKINQLYVYISSEGWDKVMNDEQVTPVSESEIPDSLDQASGDVNSVNGSEQQQLPIEPVKEDSGGFGMLAIIIIVVLVIVIIILILLLFVGGKSSLFEKYETFFDDVATLVKVNVKGNNLDRSIEEIMMILLEKFEFSQEEEKPQKGPKIKKPQNLSSKPKPEPSESEDDGLDIDLDLGNEKSEKKKTAKEKTENKITRGFDFLDEDN